MSPERSEATGNNQLNSALHLPSMLVPRGGIDLYTWSVIACDQHTAQPSYWQETAQIVGDNPSTLHLILPEVYLEQWSEARITEEIRKIQSTMEHYLKSSLFESPGPGCILIERQTPEHPRRLGLVMAIDLEQYDYKPDVKSLIRATEETVESRIPPRQKIRAQAALELSHVQLLFDDPVRQVIEPLFDQVISQKREPLYATTLMQQGGSVRGWYLSAADPLLKATLAAFDLLHTQKDYGFLLAVGDGNHSLATAKAHWEELKGHLPADHPARFALVEILNLHDPGLDFEPIHRIVTGLDLAMFQAACLDWFADYRPIFTGHPAPQKTAGQSLLTTVFYRDQTVDLVLEKGSDELPVSLLQPFLDQLVSRHNLAIDYIHGNQTLRQLSADGSIGLALPPLAKEDLFPFIAARHTLPRKTFSLGEANEKRYYLECRLIK